MMGPFSNEPMTDFSAADNRRALEEALANIKRQYGNAYPLLIGGRAIASESMKPSVNPAQHGETVGLVAQADRKRAVEAIDTAAAAFERWKRVLPSARARTLYKAAALLRQRKHEFSAWLVAEAGKTWAEADADTAEAIDFLDYYGREAERLCVPQPLVRIAGEDNEWTYVPLGVGVIIPPWNFPLAIMAGMTAAAVVAGNTAVLKPASATPVVAAQFVRLLHDAGLPEDVVQFVPGSGGEIGDTLIDHPLTRFVSFTGSMEVGLRIVERAARLQPGQRWIKRVIAELGGKDAIVVDRDADLVAASQGIVQSAFGYAGQKCSACSRAIIHADVYEEVTERVAALTRRLMIGNPAQYGTDVGPVIDRAAYNKIRQYIAAGKREGRLLVGGGMDDSAGYFVEPTIIADVESHASVAQDEIFGPVLACIQADDFGHALTIANDTPYGLTGAVYSNRRERLELARDMFHVGNLYFNRKCTGALVGVHPFGGFNLSGTDSKAGGPDYLLQFMQGKVVSEKM
ncbi:delta-1-pyrroline-5-carboxylate dehydrogenase [Paenibacillus curdlanolyticus YK9]|uniref:L-glutamate gamma-semialdehyde dehydrogenase n=1 Tax=Paenibacillus curdlanolyticus YK9 TaxID=717606 RepID=E0I3Z8_9BACL|nr:L-glutamate gamma-semialdehyde dehydrogenase [Paenibacillus curdlanolyticus]EFM13012.1 delta-1-pyrroline-5-carboxylate dehydrogenase [Paenibacillus curdlanolyticus YK9]